jgi:cytochrome c biogenesis protein ResB
LAEFFGSPMLLYSLLPVLVVVSVIGTLIPQGETAAAYAERFGGWSRLLLGLRLDDLYHSSGFSVLLALLGLNIASCTWNRRAACARRQDVLLTHVSILLILTGGLVTAVKGERGDLPLTVGQTRDWIESGTRVVGLPFTVRLNKFTVERYGSAGNHLSIACPEEGWAETLEVQPGQSVRLRSADVTVKVLGYYPDFVITHEGPATRSQAPNNPALRLELRDKQGTQKQWVFARFEGFHATAESRYSFSYRLEEPRIKQFVSELEILEGGVSKARAFVSVNAPLRWKGWTLYQAGYDEGNPDYSNLLASWDPGVPWIYIGSFLLCLGLAWTFMKGAATK